MSRREDLRVFAETWLGRPLCPSDAAGVPASLQIPTALREIYEVFGSCCALTNSHDRLLPPHAVVGRERFSIFYEENQGVALWAFRTQDALSDDPIVYRGDSTTGGWVWNSELVPVSEWIRPITLWQLVNMGYPHCAYASCIVADPSARARSIYPEVAKLGTLLFFGRDCQLVGVAGGGGISDVWVGASDHERYAHLLAQFDLEWDYDSRYD